MSGPGPALFRVMPNLGVEVGAGTWWPSPRAGRCTRRLEQRVVGLFDVLGADGRRAGEHARYGDGGIGDRPCASRARARRPGGWGSGGGITALPCAGVRAPGDARGRPDARGGRRVGGGLARQPGAARRPAPQDGVDVLEERGVRLAFQEAVEAASQRARRDAGAVRRAPVSCSTLDTVWEAADRRARC